MQEVKDKALALFENQDFQFEDLVTQIEVHRDRSRNPLFDVMFALHNQESPELEIPGLKLKFYPYETGTSKFDLVLSGIESDNGIEFSFDYCTKLFKKEAIERFIGYFKSIISAVLENPDQRLRQIGMMSEMERNQLLVDFNDRILNYANETTVYQLFEEQVKKTADHIALVYEDTQLTYKEWNKNVMGLSEIIRGL